MAKLLFIFCSVFVSQFVNTHTTGYYAIPDPEIVAFEGRGLRLIIKDEPGISVFKFHGNVNEEMKQLYPGTINIETSTKINGKWILEDRDVKLEIGDIIYYWLFVEKDRLGYVKQPVQFKIDELVPYYTEATTESTITTLRTTTRRIDPPPEPATSTPCPYPTTTTINSVSSLQSQIDTLNRKLDLITSIAALQGQVDVLAKKFDDISSSSVLQNDMKNLSKNVELIMMTLETLPETKRLTLSGVIPPMPESNADHIVRFVIWEKLQLQVNIVTAVKQNDGSIIFELKSLQEKFDVLTAAREKLKGTRINIS